MQPLDMSFAGTEANVAASLANYSIPVNYITHLSENSIADKCIKELLSYRVGTDRISFMCDLVCGLFTYEEDNQKVLDFEVAASCLKHTIKGDYNQVSVDEVKNLYKGNTSGRVK